MIPLNDAIANGAWLDLLSEENETHFRVRVSSFEEILLDQVDDVGKIELLEGGKWWLMRIEAVSLNKSKICSSSFTSHILLIDEDGFEFPVTHDGHLCWCSNYAKASGLNFFYNEPMLPKIKKRGAISFFLPDEEANYTIAFNEGTLTDL